jgi:hypothetical protein
VVVLMSFDVSQSEVTVDDLIRIRDRGDAIGVFIAAISGFEFSTWMEQHLGRPLAPVLNMFLASWLIR